MTCTATGCDQPVEARKLCVRHYAKWRRNRPGRCRYCGGDITTSPASNGQTHDRCLADRRDRWATYRDQILEAYGPQCACCGEETREFLTIDHVNGDGYLHRKGLGRGNRRVMLDIIARGFPDDFQVLCFNCNCGRARNGGVCPHEAARAPEAVTRGST